MSCSQSVELDFLSITLGASKCFEIAHEVHSNENVTFYRVTGLDLSDKVIATIVSNASVATINGMGVEVQGLDLKKIFHLPQGRRSEPLEFAVKRDEEGLSVHVWPAKSDEELIAPQNETDKDRVVVIIFDIG